LEKRKNKNMKKHWKEIAIEHFVEVGGLTQEQMREFMRENSDLELSEINAFLRQEIFDNDWTIGVGGKFVAPERLVSRIRQEKENIRQNRRILIITTLTFLVAFAGLFFNLK
jgi:hypothetical protein